MRIAAAPRAALRQDLTGKTCPAGRRSTTIRRI
jgi:hypothetical protein